MCPPCDATLHIALHCISTSIGLNIAAKSAQMPQGGADIRGQALWAWLFGPGPLSGSLGLKGLALWARAKGPGPSGIRNYSDSMLQTKSVAQGRAQWALPWAGAIGWGPAPGSPRAWPNGRGPLGLTYWPGPMGPGLASSGRGHKAWPEQETFGIIRVGRGCAQVL